MYCVERLFAIRLPSAKRVVSSGVGCGLIDSAAQLCVRRRTGILMEGAACENQRPSESLRRIPTTVPITSISPGLFNRKGRSKPLEKGRITIIFPSEVQEVQTY